MNIVAPNKSGLALGGGNYVGDSTRSMGTIGIRKNDQYYPAMNVISGRSRLQYKQTVGINTHSPMVDQYVVDLNGPIHLANGEITILSRADFEIVKMNISRTHPMYGIAIGTPYLVTSNSKYRHRVLYTIDGGENWNSSLGLFGSFPEEVLTVWTDVFVFDDRLSFIVNDNASSSIYYSTNSGVNWYAISGIEQSINSIYVNTNKRVFVSLKDLKSVYWFDTPANIYETTGFASNQNGSQGSIDFSTIFSRIIQIGGYNNTLFAIGEYNGNYRICISYNINTTPSSAAVLHEHLGVYKSLYVFNDQTVVVVGTGVVSYTNNLNTWTNVSHSYALNSVFMYDTRTTVAVGNNGTIAYSLNGNQTWNSLSVNSIRSSGTELQLLNPGYTLTNVVMTNLNNIIVSQTIRSFVWNSSDKIYGVAKVIHGFLPNVFDNPHNYVLDLSGSARISGDICISDGGKLSTTNDTFYLINENAHTVFIGNDASLISIGNHTQGQTLINRNLQVHNDSSLNRQLSVGGNTRLYQSLLADKDASFNANVSVASDTHLYGNLSVFNPATLRSRTYFLDDASLNANLFVLRDSSFNGIVSIGGTTTHRSHLYTIGDACFNGNVVVQKDQTNTGNLYVGQNTIVNNSLTVRNVVYSKYFEGSGNNADIFIGGLGLTTNDGSTTPFRTISIGSSGGIQNTQNIIRIGGGNDTIIFGGGNSGIGIEKINAGKYIFVNKVGNIGTANSSSDAGIYIVDNSNDFAGYIAVSKDMLGYKFKAPSNVSDPNILKININDMVLPSGISTGLVSLKRTSPISAYEIDSSFTLAVGTFDISNVLLKTYSPTYDSQNIQIIDTSLGILGNAYVLNHFSVGKTAASPANTVDISGILYTDKIAVSTASTNPNYQVEVSGNMFQSNGFIWQF